jgi:hypothetical protein
MAKATSFLLFIYLLEAAYGFPGNHIGSHRRQGGERHFSSKSNENHAHEIFVVNWEGCIADTVEWRVREALEVAATTWPEADDCLDRDDQIWLENKLAALAHVLAETNKDFSVVCEYALAARLLLEEQELDGGRSNGKTGKYASKYHPQQKTEMSRGRGSRPLTVGEVSANWRQGGMLRDALQVRYHCDYKDPMPILQKNVERLRAKQDLMVPRLTDKGIPEILNACPQKLILTVDHASDLNIAATTLKASELKFRIVEDVAEAFESESESALLIRRSETLAQILQHAPEKSTTFVIDSSWTTLEGSIDLFGDNIPRFGSVGKSFVPHKNLSLQLASWARNTHPSQHAAATMNAWTGLVGYTDFIEMLSARVTSN